MMNISSKEKGIIIPHWEERIKKAISTGTFTKEDFLLCENIGTCAIGERLKINKLIYGLPHIKMEKTLTPKAQQLGYEFMEKIHNQKPYEAKEVYNVIRKLKHVVLSEEEQLIKVVRKH